MIRFQNVVFVILNRKHAQQFHETYTYHNFVELENYIQSISHCENCFLLKRMALCAEISSFFNLLAPEYIVKNSLYPTVLSSSESESNDITGIWGQCI